MNPVNWSAYAQQYDLMAELNPAYQELIADCIHRVGEWKLSEQSTLADLCAGTGNFSIALARSFPSVNVLHVENNEVMLEAATAKARQLKLGNWTPMRADLSEEKWSLPPLSAAVVIHCIYTFGDPRWFIRKLHHSLVPGGMVYACDLGRRMNITDWAWYLFRNSIARRGLWNTLKLLPKTDLIRQQNRLITAAQKSGLFWTHKQAEYQSAFETSGFEIRESSEFLYRGYDNLVVARRPVCRAGP